MNFFFNPNLGLKKKRQGAGEKRNKINHIFNNNKLYSSFLLHTNYNYHKLPLQGHFLWYGPSPVNKNLNFLFLYLMFAYKPIPHCHIFPITGPWVLKWQFTVLLYNIQYCSHTWNFLLSQKRLIPILTFIIYTNNWYWY